MRRAKVRQAGNGLSGYRRCCHWGNALAGWERRERLVQQHRRLRIATLLLVGRCRCCSGLLLPSSHEGLVTGHTEDALRRSGVSKIFDLAFAVSTSETARTVGLVASQDGQILDFIPTGTAAVGATVANEGAIAQQKEIWRRSRAGCCKCCTESSQYAIDCPLSESD